MNRRRSALFTMLVISIAIHLLLSAGWSIHRLHVIRNVAESTSHVFTAIKLNASPQRVEVVPPKSTAIGDVVPARRIDQPEGKKKPLPPSPVAIPTPAAPDPNPKKPINVQPAIADAPKIPVGPFHSEIDPKQAWINVAESVNYGLLRGITVDISQGEYRLQDEMDVRVRAKGDLRVEYPLIAAAVGKEAVLYVLLLIDEQGRKIRVQIVRGNPDFDQAVLQSLETVEFRPAVLKGTPLKSMLLLEFEFRRNPPEVGSL